MSRDSDNAEDIEINEQSRTVSDCGSEYHEPIDEKDKNDEVEREIRNFDCDKAKNRHYHID